MQVVRSARISPAVFGRDEFANWLSHPVQISHISWASTTTSAVIADDLVSTWLSTMPANLSNKIANFYYLKSNIRLKFVIQGAPYAAGQMVMSAFPKVQIPEYGYVASDRADVFTPVNGKIVPHVILDPSKTATYELDLPICTQTGVWSLKTPNYGSYHLSSFVYNTLFSGTATEPTVAVCVYMSMVNPETDGLTLLSNEFEKEKQEGGTLSSFLKRTGAYAPMLGVAFPELSPFTTLFSTAASGVGDLLAYFGFSKPPQVENVAFILNRIQDNYSQFDGKSTAMVLAGSAKTSLGLSNSLAGGDYDDMLIANIISKPGAVVIGATIAQTVATGTLVATYPIHPLLIGGVDPTPLAGISHMFTYWTGDMDVTFEFVASVFHRATVVIAYDPLARSGTAAPTLATAITTLKNVTVNITGNTSVDIHIPWKQLHQWALLAGYVNAFPGGTAWTNGGLYLFVLNPVLTNGSTDGISYNVYYSSKNMAFSLPTANNIKNVAINTTLLSNDFCPVTKESFGSPTDLSTVFTRTYGEPVHSLKELSCRVASFTGDITVPVTPGNYHVWNVASMPNSLNFGSINMFGFILSAFLGYRGGVRFAFHSHAVDLPAVTVLHPVVNVNHAGTVFTNPYQISSATTGDLGADYAWNSNNTSICSRTDVVAPMLCPWDFIPAGLNYTSSVDGVRFAQFVASSAATPNIVTNVHSGSADDAQFVWFLGFPSVTSLS